jgi:hypothetical protein
MASEILGLFGGKNPQQLQQDYLSGLMVSPAQMGQQGLLQQLISTGANAGAMMGYGAGRLFGGKVPGEVEQETIKNIYQDIQKLNLPTESEKYKVFASKLGEAGLTPQAALAAERASKAYSSELKDKETVLGIEEKSLSNYFNRATLLPRVQEKFVALESAQQAVKAAQQAYAQADKMNPLAVKQAAATLANTQQTYQRVAAEMKQFEQLSPSVVAEAKANATSAQLTADTGIQKKALQDIMATNPPGSDAYNFALQQLSAIESPTSLMPTKPGEAAERYAAADFGKPYAQLDKEQKLQVNNKIDAQKIAQSAATGTGNAKVTDAGSALERIRIETQGSRDLLDSADEGLRNLSLGSGVADQLVNRALATMSGDKSLSMAEVQSIANRNGFVGSVANAVEGFTTGRMSAISRRDKRILLEAYREAAVNRVNKQLDYLKGVYQSTSFSKEQVEQLIEPRRPKSTIEFKVETYSKFPYEPKKYDYKFEDGKVFRAPK